MPPKKSTTDVVNSRVKNPVAVNIIIKGTKHLG